MKTKIISILALITIACIVMSHSAGISGQTGSPSETTCAKSGCHNSFALNSGTGSIAVTHNIPVAGYTPGQTYSVSVTVSKTSVTLFGFDFEALTPSNTTAGNITVTSTATTQLMTASGSGRQNITHKTDGGLTTNSHVFSFNWTAPGTNIGNVTFFAAGIAANNNNNANGDYVYSTSLVIPANNVCMITTGTITGNPFCAGQTGISIPYTANGTYTSGNVFTAQLSDAAGSFASSTTLGTLSSTTSGTIISSTALPSTAGTKYRIRVIASNPATTGTDNGTDITINLLPTTANAGPDQSVCGTNATLAGNTATIGSGTWTLVNGAGTITTATSPASIITALGAGANTFKWTITNSCGTSSDNVIITGVASPTVANAGPDQTACTTSATLAGNSPINGTGLWTKVSGTGTITTPASPTSSITGLGAGSNTFRWTISNAPCTASFDDVIITQSGTITVANAGPDQTICASTSSLAGNAPSVGTGSWSLVSGSGTITTLSSATSGVTALGVGANTFRWTISNGSCSPSTDDVIITVMATPTMANAGADQTVCTTSATFAGNNPTTGTGLWTRISGAGTITTPSSPTSTVTGLGAGSNTFRWTISNNPCTATSDDVIITRSGTITVSNAGPDQTVCGASATLAGNTATSGTGAWTLISGSGTITTASSPTSTVTGLGAGANVFRWTISNGACIPSTDDVTITSKSSPTIANAGADQTICGTSTTMAANTPLSGTGLWTRIAGTGTITNSTSPTSTITTMGMGSNKFVWTISNSPCPSSADTVVIAAFANPTTANAGPDQTICNTTATLAANLPSVGSGLWSLISGSGIFTTPTSPTTAVTSLGNGINTFRWTISNGACTPSTSDVTIINCNSITVGPINGSPFCATTSYSVTVSFTKVGTFTGIYSAELSDANGSFTTPVVIGSAASSPISAMIPSSSLAGSGYRIRVTNSSPVFKGSDNGVDLSINTCPPITTGTITGSPFCKSTSYSVSVPFTFSGSFSGPFIAQLSNASGSFASPITIGYANTSPIAAAIPSGAVAGTGYRIRVSDYGAGIDGQDNGIDLSINTCGIIGIDELDQNNLISIYPNPNQGNFYIVFNENSGNKISIEIENLIGKCLVKKEYPFLNSNEPVSFEIPDAIKGVYFLRMQTAEQVIIKRILVD